MDIKAVMHLGRFTDIIFTLFKYGFEDIVERLELPGKVIIKRIHEIDRDLTTAERIRLTLDELGPTFIKFGQLLSLRPDIIPIALIMELRKLQDEVMPVPFPDIVQAMERALGRPLNDVFLHFEEKPYAAASLAQVHRAVLREERQVVAVKIQRPGIRQVIETDLYILDAIARKLHERMEAVQIYRLPELMRQLRRSLLRELDFSREVRNMKIAQHNFSENPEIHIPRVFDAYCTERVITMEFVNGVRLKDLDVQSLADREILARRGVAMAMKQILEDGFFHADPHPGNIFILEGNVFCLLDWGLVGRLTRETRFEIIDLIASVVDKDSEKMLDTLLEMTVWDPGINQRLLQEEILEILDAYHSIPLRELNVGQLLMEIAALLRQSRLKLPIELAMMIKALLSAEGTARQIYPDLNVVAEAEPYVQRLAVERWKPRVLWQSLTRNVSHFLALQKQFPIRMNRIIEKIDQGDLSIQFQHKNLEGLRDTMENITNRITSGVIIGSMIIGSSMIITTGVEPLLFGYPAFGIIGYVISGILGLWLIYNIFRSRKF